METPEKYNGMTPEQIKEWLADKERFVFIKRNKIAALEYIERLEKKVADAEAAIEERDAVINLMQIQMMGDCGVCKHKKEPEVCKECMSIAYHPDWEYEGLPEIPQKGES